MDLGTILLLGLSDKERLLQGRASFFWETEIEFMMRYHPLNVACKGLCDAASSAMWFQEEHGLQADELDRVIIDKYSSLVFES